MTQHNQARKNDARRLQRETGRSYQSAVQHLRKELQPARVETVVDDRDTVRGPVPSELPRLAAHHIDAICGYFHHVLDHQYLAHHYGDWCRIALYRLTDAQEHLHLLIGTIAAHMQHHGVIPQRIASNLQVRSVDEVHKIITTDARHQLAGILGLPCPGPEETPLDIDCSIGEGIAQRSGFVHAEREATLEAFLAALYSGYPYDPTALDDLPDVTRCIAERAAGLSSE
ncbi:hypothetical protein [Streptomyces sp. NPDC095817]|uniref:hypothetical protein n=1 Tax=Streptomyces sp. NPDC095817 TaxID=3155082 RepID=UPI003318847B